MSSLQESTKSEKTSYEENIFVLMNHTSIYLKQLGMEEEIPEMRDEVTSSGSYTKAVEILQYYCPHITSDGYILGCHD